MTDPTDLENPEATELVVRILEEDPAVAAALRAGAVVKVFDGVAPQGTARPYVTVRTIGDPSTHHQGGVSAIRNPLTQVDLWADDAAQRRRVGKLLRARLDGFQGNVSTARVQRITVEVDVPTEEPRADAAGSFTFRRRMDVAVWYVP